MNTVNSAPAERPIAINRTHLDNARKVRRTRRLREFAKRIARRSKSAYILPCGGLKRRARRRKRKAALAASAAIMGLSTAATASFSAPDAQVSTTENTRQNADKLSASEALMQALAEEEGVRLTVYRDAIGKPTVGVGHLVRAEDGLAVGDTITMEQAMDFLESDLKSAEAAVHRLVGDLPLHQHEFDALVDLVFNIGEGNAGEKNSPRLNAAIAARDYAGIAEELAYHHAASRSLDGLIYRSERRVAIFTMADYADPRPAHRALASVDFG